MSQGTFQGLQFGHVDLISQVIGDRPFLCSGLIRRVVFRKRLLSARPPGAAVTLQKVKAYVTEEHFAQGLVTRGEAEGNERAAARAWSASREPAPERFAL